MGSAQCCSKLYRGEYRIHSILRVYSVLGGQLGDGVICGPAAFISRLPASSCPHRKQSQNRDKKSEPIGAIPGLGGWTRGRLVPSETMADNGRQWQKTAENGNFPMALLQHPGCHSSVCGCQRRQRGWHAPGPCGPC